jgi:hypothetical protein
MPPRLSAAHAASGALLRSRPSLVELSLGRSFQRQVRNADGGALVVVDGAELARARRWYRLLRSWGIVPALLVPSAVISATVLAACGSTRPTTNHQAPPATGTAGSSASATATTAAPSGGAPATIADDPEASGPNDDNLWPCSLLPQSLVDSLGVFAFPAQGAAKVYDPTETVHGCTYHSRTRLAQPLPDRPHAFAYQWQLTENVIDQVAPTDGTPVTLSGGRTGYETAKPNSHVTAGALGWALSVAAPTGYLQPVNYQGQTQGIYQGTVSCGNCDEATARRLVEQVADAALAQLVQNQGRPPRGVQEVDNGVR